MSRMYKSIPTKVGQWLPGLGRAGEKWEVTAKGYGISFQGD